MSAEKDERGRSLFSAWMEHCGWGPAEASRRLGIDRSTVYRYLRGAGWTRYTQHRMAKALGLSQEEFLAGPPGWSQDEQNEPVRRFRLAFTGGLVDVPFYVGIPDSGFEELPDDTYPVPSRDAGPGRCVIEVTDDGMSPRVRPGDKVLVDTDRIKPQSQDTVVVQVEDKRYLAQWVIRDRKVYLEWLNGRWPAMKVEDSTRVKVLGTAIRIVSGDL